MENPYESPRARSAARGRERNPYVWRLTVALALAAAMGLPFAFLHLQLVLLGLVAADVAAGLVFSKRKRPRYEDVAFLAAMLMGAAIYFTEWGFDSPRPRICVAWAWFIPACAAQLAVASMPLWPLLKRRFAARSGDRFPGTKAAFELSRRSESA